MGVPRPRPPHRQRLDIERFSLVRAIWLISGAAVSLTVVAGVLMRIANPEEFDDYGEGLWFSVVTVGTVGYGDLVPTNWPGRFIAALVILFSMALFPVLAGLASAALVARNERRRDAERAREDAARHDDLVARYDALMARLASLESRLDDPARDGGGEPPAGGP
jgi:voltage-gated potassium channel Kch